MTSEKIILKNESAENIIKLHAFLVEVKSKIYTITESNLARGLQDTYTHLKYNHKHGWHRTVEDSYSGISITDFIHKYKVNKNKLD